MREIAILVDSGTDVPKEYIERYGIRVLPLTVNYQALSYRDGVDITPEQVLDRLDLEIPHTSLPTPAAAIAAFRAIRDKGFRQVMVVTISAGLSGVHNLLRMVSGEFPEMDIRVLDTKNIGIGAGMTAIRAAELAETGMGLDALEAVLKTLVRQTKIFFCIPSLWYLQKGGRIGRVSATMGSLLGIRPVITCDESGVYCTAKKARGDGAALNAAIGMAAAHAAEAPRKFRLAVAFAGGLERAKAVLESVERKIPGSARMYFGSVGSALAVHTGPGLIGIGVQCY